MAWVSEVEINFICQFWIFLFSRRAPCLPVLGYLTDCPWPFKVLQRIELVLKTNCFYILWIIHFIQLLNFWSIQWTISLNCVLLLWYVMTSFMSNVFWTFEMWNICMYVCNTVYTRDWYVLLCCYKRSSSVSNQSLWYTRIRKQLKSFNHHDRSSVWDLTKS
jgi:hypothetical protein